MPFTQHDTRLLRSMIFQIDLFPTVVSFEELCDTLSGLFDAADLEDSEFRHTWLELWGRMEELRGLNVEEWSSELSAAAAELRSHVFSALGES